MSFDACCRAPYILISEGVAEPIMFSSLLIWSVTNSCCRINSLVDIVGHKSDRIVLFGFKSSLMYYSREV